MATFTIKKQYRILQARAMKIQSVNNYKDLVNIGISTNEILINKLFLCTPFEKNDILEYSGTYNGYKFAIDHSIDKYVLKIASEVGGSFLRGITIKTGYYDEATDILLEMLYWHIADAFHNETVEKILELENVHD